MTADIERVEFAEDDPSASDLLLVQDVPARRLPWRAVSSAAVAALLLAGVCAGAARLALRGTSSDTDRFQMEMEACEDLTVTVNTVVRPWTDVHRGSCKQYFASEWCDGQGGYGPGWDPTDPLFGEFEQYRNYGHIATEACCACGGGITATTTTPTPVPTASPTASPTAAPTASPTASPTAAPTASPTAAPTPPPTQADYLKIREKGYPANTCATFTVLGKYDGIDACMEAVRDQDGLAFAYIDGGRQNGLCYKENIEVTAEVWADAMNHGVSMRCPGKRNRWVKNNFASTYVMNPSIFGTG